MEDDPIDIEIGEGGCELPLAIERIRQAQRKKIGERRKEERRKGGKED